MRNRFTVGRIQSSHGLKGEVSITSYSGETEHFAEMERMTAVSGERCKELVVESIRGGKKRLIAKFASVDTVDEAKELAGWELWVDRSDAAPLGPEEYYTADVVGCDVLYRDEKIGTVEYVGEGGQGVLLGVSTEEGTKIVPFLHVFFGTVDVEAGEIELLVDWILE
jgi:16S rRNA processing protein RimM